MTLKSIEITPERAWRIIAGHHAHPRAARTSLYDTLQPDIRVYELPFNGGGAILLVATVGGFGVCPVSSAVGDA